MDWNFFKHVALIAQTGSLTRAARELGVHESTISRHLQRFETRTGVRIFRRQGNRYICTADGLAYVDKAKQMSALVGDLSQQVLRVRVTSVESFICHYLLPALAHQEHLLDFIASTSNLDLSRREADIAVRFGRQARGDLRIRKLCSVGYAVYGSRERPRSSERTGRSAPWVVLSDLFDSTQDNRWFAAQSQPHEVRMRVTSYAQIQAAIRRTECLGILPCYVGDDDVLLERRCDAPVFSRDAWLIVHSIVTDQPAVKRIKAQLIECAKRDSTRLAGLQKL